MPLNPSVEKFHNMLAQARGIYRRQGEFWLLQLNIKDYIEILEATVAPLKEVWVVHYMNMEPAEVDSIHATEESAKRRHEILGPSWKIDKWTVQS